MKQNMGRMGSGTEFIWDDVDTMGRNIRALQSGNSYNAICEELSNIGCATGEGLRCSALGLTRLAGLVQ